MARTKKPAKKVKPEKPKLARAAEKLRVARWTEAQCVVLLESWKAAVEKAHRKQVAIRKQKLTMQVTIAGTLLGSLVASWTRRHPGTPPFLFDYALVLSVADPAGDAALVTEWLASLNAPLATLVSAARA